MALQDEAAKLDFRSVFLGAIVTALSFVVGLFWRDAITETVDKLIPETEGLFYKYLVAIIVTVTVVIIIFVLIKTSEVTDKYDDKLKARIKQKKEKLVGKKLLKKG